MHPTWTLGWVVGGPVAIFLTLVFLLLVIWTVRGAIRAGTFDRAEWIMGSVFSGLGLITTVVLSLMTLWPLQTAYHRWVPVTGTVAQASYQVQGDDNSVYRDFTFKLQGQQNVYTCGDSRCSAVKSGDTVNLMCVKQNVYAATDTYDCRLVRIV